MKSVSEQIFVKVMVVAPSSFQIGAHGTFIRFNIIGGAPAGLIGDILQFTKGFDLAAVKNSIFVTSMHNVVFL